MLRFIFPPKEKNVKTPAPVGRIKMEADIAEICIEFTNDGIKTEFIQHQSPDTIDADIHQYEVDFTDLNERYKMAQNGFHVQQNAKLSVFTSPEDKQRLLDEIIYEIKSYKIKHFAALHGYQAKYSPIALDSQECTDYINKINQQAQTDCGHHLTDRLEA